MKLIQEMNTKLKEKRFGKRIISTIRWNYVIIKRLVLFRETKLIHFNKNKFGLS